MSSPSPTLQAKNDVVVEKDAADPFQVGLDENDDPRRRSNARKWLAVLLISSTSLCATCASSMASFTEQSTMEEFHASRTVAILSISLFVEGLGWGPLLVGPLSSDTDETLSTASPSASSSSSPSPPPPTCPSSASASREPADMWRRTWAMDRTRRSGRRRSYASEASVYRPNRSQRGTLTAASEARGKDTQLLVKLIFLTSDSDKHALFSRAGRVDVDDEVRVLLSTVTAGYSNAQPSFLPLMLVTKHVIASFAKRGNRGLPERFP
ncbi:hypothetical protein FB107DRAFT_252439 [Schizophyllum commune]